MSAFRHVKSFVVRVAVRVDARVGCLLGDLGANRAGWPVSPQSLPASAGAASAGAASAGAASGGPLTNAQASGSMSAVQIAAAPPLHPVWQNGFVLVPLVGQQ
jgi:hypothetical protein